MIEQIQEITPPAKTEPVLAAPTPPKKSNLVKVILLVVLGLIVMAGAVYAGMQIERKRVKLWTELPSTEPTPTEAPLTEIESQSPEITSVTPDETANWKTYRNEEYGFEFKYPSDWPIDNEAPRDESVIVVVLSRISEKFGREMIYVGVWDTKTNIWNTFEEFLNRRRLDHPIEDIVIGQTIKAKRIYIPQGQDGPFDIVAFEHMGKIYEFSATCAKESSVQYDQILSTFKFTE